jgi:hypothetical protein
MILGNPVRRDISAPWDSRWPRCQKGLLRLLPKRNFGFHDFTDPDASSLTLQLSKPEMPKYWGSGLHKSSDPSPHYSNPGCRNVEVPKYPGVRSKAHNDPWDRRSLSNRDFTISRFKILKDKSLCLSNLRYLKSQNGPMVQICLLSMITTPPKLWASRSPHL